MKRCLLLFTLALAITACQKKPVTPVTVTMPAVDFLPLAPGNTWTYGIKGWADGDGNFSDTVVFTATAMQKTFNGKTYTLVLANKPIFYPGIDSFYFYKNPVTQIYSWLFPGQGLPRAFDAPILDARPYAKISSSVDIPASNSSQPAPYRVSAIGGSIGYTETVTGQIYNGVSQVGVTILDRDSTAGPYYGDWQYYNEYAFDFAPNVGILRMVDANWQGAIALIHYHVKP